MRRAAGEMPMFKVLLSRLGQAALVMLVVSAVSFVMFRYVGDPVATMSRENASVEEKANSAAPSVSINRWSFSMAASSTRTLSGDLGISYRNQRPVTELIAERLPGDAGARDRRDVPVARPRHSARGAVRAQAQRRRGTTCSGPLSCRHFDPDLRDRHRAHPGLRRVSRLAALIRTRAGRRSRLVVDGLSHDRAA